MKTVSFYVAVTIVGVFAFTPPTKAGILQQWKFNPSANQLEISLQEETKPNYFFLKEPARIVIDLPNTTIGTVAKEQTYLGAVRQVRVSQFQPDVTRIVVELSPQAALAPEKVQILPNSTQPKNRWVFRPLITELASDTPNSILLPPASFPISLPEATVSVPPLKPTINGTPQQTNKVVEFGQPLPQQKAAQTLIYYQTNNQEERPTPTVIVPPLNPPN